MTDRDLKDYKNILIFEASRYFAFNPTPRYEIDNCINSIRRHIKRMYKIRKYSNYDLYYKNVYCSAVKWDYKNRDTFIFWYYGKMYKYKPISKIYSSSDTDHIRMAIHLFIKEIIKQCYKCLYCGCGECPRCKY